MPINRERFDAIKDDEAATTAERIIEFLYENRDHAFTRSEIAEGIDRSPNTVGTNLSRLKERNLVQHKDRYWTITDDLEQLSDAVQFSELLSGLTERFGPLIHDEEDAQAWADAQPDEPHPSEQKGTDTASTGSDSTAEGELND
jgi:hypothetical protein